MSGPAKNTLYFRPLDYRRNRPESTASKWFCGLTFVFGGIGLGTMATIVGLKVIELRIGALRGTIAFGVPGAVCLFGPLLVKHGKVEQKTDTKPEPKPTRKFGGVGGLDLDVYLAKSQAFCDGLTEEQLALVVNHKFCPEYTQRLKEYDDENLPKAGLPKGSETMYQSMNILGAWEEIIKEAYWARVAEREARERGLNANHQSSNKPPAPQKPAAPPSQAQNASSFVDLEFYFSDAAEYCGKLPNEDVIELANNEHSRSLGEKTAEYHQSHLPEGTSLRDSDRLQLPRRWHALFKAEYKRRHLDEEKVDPGHEEKEERPYEYKSSEPRPELDSQLCDHKSAVPPDSPQRKLPTRDVQLSENNTSLQFQNDPAIKLWMQNSENEFNEWTTKELLEFLCNDKYPCPEAGNRLAALFKELEGATNLDEIRRELRAVEDELIEKILKTRENLEEIAQLEIRLFLINGMDRYFEDFEQFVRYDLSLKEAELFLKNNHEDNGVELTSSDEEENTDRAKVVEYNETSDSLAFKQSSFERTHLPYGKCKSFWNTKATEWIDKKSRLAAEITILKKCIKEKEAARLKEAGIDTSTRADAGQSVKVPRNFEVEDEEVLTDQDQRFLSHFHVFLLSVTTKDLKANGEKILQVEKSTYLSTRTSEEPIAQKSEEALEQEMRDLLESALKSRRDH